MKTLNRMLTATLLVACSLNALAGTTWDAVKKRVAEGKSYTTEYKYDGPKGKFKFDYRAVVPDHIRSEIKEASDQSRVGIVAVYDAAWKQVRYRSGGGIIPRNLDHPDVKGTAFMTPVFSLIVDQIGASNKPTSTSTEGDRTKFEFKTDSGRFTLWARDNGDIVKTERIDNKTRGKEMRDFSSIKWNNDPKTGF